MPNPYAFFAYVAAFATTLVKGYMDCRVCDGGEHNTRSSSAVALCLAPFQFNPDENHTCHLKNFESECVMLYLTSVGWTAEEAFQWIFEQDKCSGGAYE